MKHDDNYGVDTIAKHKFKNTLEFGDWIIGEFENVHEEFNKILDQF